MKRIKHIKSVNLFGTLLPVSPRIIFFKRVEMSRHVLPVTLFSNEPAAFIDGEPPRKNNSRVLSRDRLRQTNEKSVKKKKKEGGLLKLRLILFAMIRTNGRLAVT